MRCVYTVLRPGVALGLLALMFGLVLGGCAGTWGSLKTNPELLAGVQNRSVDPGLDYYYCGRSGLPYAVVGIDRAYTFKSRFWFKIDTMAEVYKKIDNLSNLEPFHDRRYARDVVSPEGRVVGIYFSYYYATAVVVDEAAKEVWVYNPYKPESGFTRGI